MLHKYKLLVTLSFLSLFIISCSSTKLEIPSTEGEEHDNVVGEAGPGLGY